MIIDNRIYVSSMCPACGNYYYGSGVCSYNTFGATVFSDGYLQGCYSPYWLTRCPKCKQIFAKEHLFDLPENITVFPPSPYLSPRTKRKLENDELFGRVDDYLEKDETKLEFIEKAIEQGLYFPVTVSESRKKELKTHLLKDLWHQYNMQSEATSNAAYKKLCFDIINSIEDKAAPTNEEFLTLAELYRNVGEFEKCLIMLDGIAQSSNNTEFIDAIRKEAIAKNKKTVTVIEGKW